MDYTNYNKRTYNPKKAVKNFTDLEVYQKSLEAGVFIANAIFKVFQEKQKKAIKESSANKNAKKNIETKDLVNEISDVKEYVIKNMIACALSIPHLIAESHSNRFGSSEKCLLMLDQVMLNCNKMVVYLEQTRDICETELEVEQFEEQTKKYFYIRRKVLNLQRVWRKYIKINKDEGK